MRNVGMPGDAGDDRLLKEAVDRVLTMTEQLGSCEVDADIAARRDQD